MEDQQEKGDSGKQDEQKGVNLGIDKTDQESDLGEAGDTGGGPEDRDQEQAGANSDKSAGPGGLPDEISEEQAAASQAVERFDQLDTGSGDAGQGNPQDGIPDKDGVPGTSISMTVMDQWLEQIEGDPAHLLRNQFRIAEQQEMQRNRRQLMETRPW